MSHLNDLYQLITLPKITDLRGNLSFIEENEHVPFDIKRTYWLYDVPGESYRGEGHAYREAHELFVPLSGSFQVEICNGSETHTIELKSPNKGLYIRNRTWRKIHSFTTNAVCLVLSSLSFQQDDYIYDWETYKTLTEHAHDKRL